MISFRTSLTAKFFAAFALTALLIILMLAGAVVWSMRDGFARYLLQEELALFDDVVDGLSERHDPSNPGWPELAKDSDAWAAFVMEQVEPFQLGDPNEDVMENDGGPPSLIAKLYVLDASGREVIAPRLRGDLVATLPIPDPDGGKVAIGWLGVSSLYGDQPDANNFFLRGQYRNLALVSLAALLLSIAAAIALGRQLLQPIKALEAGARSLSDGDLTTRIVNTRQDELGQLIDHTNAMAQNLQSARDAEQQWISDTSHELQTPLAVLRAQIEAIQDGVEQADPRTLNEMRSAVLRLSRLVGDLKVLSFAREGQATIHAEPVDLADVLDLCLEGAERQLFAAGLTLERQINRPLTISGDSGRLAQVFDNILQNTVRYTDAPGALHVSAWHEGPRVVVTFEDTTPAPPDDVLPQLFNRFFRAEASRSRATGGSGLGLAICKATVIGHGGTIAADISPLGGLRIRITLPTGAPSDDSA